MATPTFLDTYSQTISPIPTPTAALSAINTDQAAPTTFPEEHEDEERRNNGILNYYFLLLAFIVILLGILYLTYARRQRQRLALRRQNGQRALARDLERWGGGGPWGPSRLPRIPRNTSGVRRPQPPRREEGLNENGEAPPPYIPKEPERAYVGSQRGGLGNDIPLRDMGSMDHKPPDYDEGPSSRGAAAPGPVMRGD